MPFEYAVRPFQAPDSFGRAIIPSVPSARARATLTWGAKTTVKDIVPERTGINVECCSEHLTEVARKTNTVELRGGGNYSSENYLVVERATEVKLQKTHQDSCGDDLEQISGVASGIKEAFADLKADIEAGGAGVTDTACQQTLHFTENTSPYPYDTSATVSAGPAGRALRRADRVVSRTLVPVRPDQRIAHETRPR